MTQDEVMKMAFKAGVEDSNEYNHLVCTEVELAAFAKLVAAAEREACAMLAQKTVCDTHIPTGVKIYGTVAAKVIRARGQA